MPSSEEILESLTTREAVATTVEVFDSMARKKLRNFDASADVYPSRLCAQRYAIG